MLNVDEAGVLEVSGKDKKAKQSERRRLPFGTIWSLCAWLRGTREADNKFQAKLSKELELPTVAQFNVP